MKFISLIYRKYNFFVNWKLFQDTESLINAVSSSNMYTYMLYLLILTGNCTCEISLVNKGDWSSFAFVHCK